MIAKLRQWFPLEKLSLTLDVARSGYYRFLQQDQGKRAQEDEALYQAIKCIFYEHHKRYGSPRIHQELKERGIMCGKKRVARIMKTKGLKGLQIRKWKKCPIQEKKENILNREFSSNKANDKWVSDITYIKTTKGWVYLCAVMDLFSRKIVGHSVENHMRQGLVVKALQQGVNRREPPILFHSDQGSQYRSEELCQYMENQGITPSMSGVGSCYDNAPMESFFSSLKRECIQGKKYDSLEKAQLEIFHYIESYYNNKRKHSTLGFLSPAQFEEKAFVTN